MTFSFLDWIFYSNSNIVAAKNGILLWANSVLPTLFPFFIAAELLYRTNFVNLLRKLLNKFITDLIREIKFKAF